MAKIINSSNSVNSGKYVFLFVCFAFLVVNAALIFYTFYVLNMTSTYKTKFVFDEKKLKIFIDNAVTNYLDSIGYTNLVLNLKNSDNKSETLHHDNMPKVISVKGCTWLTPYKKFRCMLDGLEYGVNDFSPYGLILAVADGRVYVQYGDSIRIIRVVHDAADDASGLREHRRPDDGRSLVNRPYLNKEGEINEY